LGNGGRLDGRGHWVGVERGPALAGAAATDPDVEIEPDVPRRAIDRGRLRQIPTSWSATRSGSPSGARAHDRIDAPKRSRRRSRQPLLRHRRQLKATEPVGHPGPVRCRHRVPRLRSRTIRTGKETVAEGSHRDARRHGRARGRSCDCIGAPRTAGKGPGEIHAVMRRTKGGSR
jgi:hypothetical protein